MVEIQEPLCVDQLLRAVEQGLAPDYLFFWGHTSRTAWIGKECLSQWFPASFTVDGETFATAEHYMMFEKAVLFGDKHAASQILTAGHPGEAKELGRHVRGFDEDLWETRRFEIVTKGNRAKFGQNPKLREFLAQTKRRVLVEASPRDTIWGIGLAETDRAARDVDRWRGLNLLGFALMQVRRDLRGSPLEAH